MRHMYLNATFVQVSTGDWERPVWSPCRIPHMTWGPSLAGEGAGGALDGLGLPEVEVLPVSMLHVCIG